MLRHVQAVLFIIRGGAQSAGNETDDLTDHEGEEDREYDGDQDRLDLADDVPVKFDWEGRQLDEVKRAEFLNQQAVAALQKRVVIPVRIKGRWLLFEGPNQAPALPDDVRATLTAAEVAAFKHDWLELEAELWAREVAADLPEPAPSTGEK